MSLPGFTAEASLYKTSQLYRMAKVGTSTAQMQLLPQQIVGGWISRIPNVSCCSDCIIRCFNDIPVLSLSEMKKQEITRLPRSTKWN